MPGTLRPKRSRKRSHYDRPYHPRQDRRPRTRSETAEYKNNLLAMRADTSVTIVTIDGEMKPLKTSILVSYPWAKENFYDIDALQRHLSESMTSISTYRPAAEVTEVNEKQSPTKIITPKKTKLQRIGTFGSFSLFSNQAIPSSSIASPIKEMPKLSSFTETEAYQALKAVLDPIKLQTTTITTTSLQQRKSAHRRNGYKRSTSQNATMVKEGVSAKKGSATGYAKAAELFCDTMRWEWLHMIAHMILGTASQNEKNLVAGTDHSNTEMMFIEAQIPYLAQQYPEGFELTVKANLIPGTHIATTIEYKIKTRDFDFPLVFNAQTTQQPHQVLQHYMRALIDALISTHKVTAEIDAATATSSSSSSKVPLSPETVPLPFFRKASPLKIMPLNFDVVKEATSSSKKKKP